MKNYNQEDKNTHTYKERKRETERANGMQNFIIYRIHNVNIFLFFFKNLFYIFASSVLINIPRAHKAQQGLPDLQHLGESMGGKRRKGRRRKERAILVMEISQSRSCTARRVMQIGLPFTRQVGS